MRVTLGRCLASVLVFVLVLALMPISYDAWKYLSFGYLLGALRLRMIANRIVQRAEDHSDMVYKARARADAANVLRRERRIG